MLLGPLGVQDFPQAPQEPWVAGLYRTSAGLLTSAVGLRDRPPFPRGAMQCLYHHNAGHPCIREARLGDWRYRAVKRTNKQKKGCDSPRQSCDSTFAVGSTLVWSRSLKSCSFTVLRTQHAHAGSVEGSPFRKTRTVTDRFAGSRMPVWMIQVQAAFQNGRVVYQTDLSGVPRRPPRTKTQWRPFFFIVPNDCVFGTRDVFFFGFATCILYPKITRTILSSLFCGER